MQFKFLTIDATACGLEDGTEESHAQAFHAQQVLFLVLLCYRISGCLSFS